MLGLLAFTLSCARSRSSPARELQAFVVGIVQLLADSTPDGKVQLSPLGSMSQTHSPAFSTKTLEHVCLLSTIKA